MDQGQWSEVMGRANAAYIESVVLPRAERRAAQLRQLQAAAVPRAPRPRSPWRVGAAWLGGQVVALGEWLRAVGSRPVGSGT